MLDLACGCYNPKDAIRHLPELPTINICSQDFMPVLALACEHLVSQFRLPPKAHLIFYISPGMVWRGLSLADVMRHRHEWS